MVDSISRNDLLKEYNETRTSIRSDEKELHELLQHSLAYLTSRAAEKRFPKLGCLDLYRELRKLVSNSDSHHGDAILKIKAGFSHLEQYALNLLRSPWRKEFHVIKTYTGFFKCKVQRSLPETTTAWLITCLGYKQDDESGDHFLLKEGALKEPFAVHEIQEVSLDLFLVTVELQIIYEIASFAEPEGYSLKQVIRARYKTVKGTNEAISWLQNEPKEESKKKKLELDKDSDTRKEPAEGHKPSERNRGERTSSSQRLSEQKQNDETNIRRPKSSVREMKFPPSFPTEYSSSDRAYTRDGSSAYYSHSGVFGPGHTGTFVSDSYIGPGSVAMEQLTDDVLYGHGDHSTDHQFPASEEMVSPSHSNGFTDEHHNTMFSQELPPSSKGKKLCVKLPEETPATPKSTAPVALYQNLPGVFPNSPPPTYEESLLLSGSNHEDFVLIERPRQVEVDRVMPKNMCAGELPYRKIGDYNPQLYQGSGSRESDVASINVVMSKTLTLDVTSSGTADTGRSGHGDKYNLRTALYRPESGALIPDTAHWTKSLRSESSSRKVPHSGEPRKSIPDQARPQNEIKRCRYQDGQDPPGNTRNSKEDKDGSQVSATGICTSQVSGLVAGKYQTSLDTPKLTHCEFCSLDVSGFICESCFKMACGNCQEIYNTDPCEKAENAKNHKFVDVRKDNKKKPSHLRRLAGAPTESVKTWYCVRCTYVNPVESNVCTMCAKTRGMSNPEPPEPGSPVCRECTYCNKEGSDVCQMCGKSLHFGTAETSV